MKPRSNQLFEIDALAHPPESISQLTQAGIDRYQIAYVRYSRHTSQSTQGRDRIVRKKMERGEIEVQPVIFTDPWSGSGSEDIWAAEKLLWVQEHYFDGAPLQVLFPNLLASYGSTGKTITMKAHIWTGPRPRFRHSSSGTMPFSVVDLPFKGVDRDTSRAAKLRVRRVL
jgi:hypothetical protein